MHLETLMRCCPPRASERIATRLSRWGFALREKAFERSPLRYAPRVTMKLVPGDLISESIAWSGFYELPLTRQFVGMARRGGLLVDVGANLGYFSLLWASGGVQNKVIAFEASPRNQNLLKENIERNGFEKQVQIRHEAVGKETGTARFSLGPKEQTGWGGITLSGENQLEVPLIRLDEALPVDTKISLLKIDIEGADTWALEGARKLLERKQVELVWFEQNLDRMTKLGIQAADAQSFLSQVGYTVKPAFKNSANDFIALPC